MAFRFRCSALAKVSFSSLVRARVKWLPPIGTFRCQIRVPSVMIRSVLSAPMSSRTTESLAPLPFDLVERDVVVEGDRAHLDDVDLDAGDRQKAGWRG